MQIKNKFPDAKIIWGGDFNCVHNDLLDRWPVAPKEDKKRMPSFRVNRYLALQKSKPTFVYME